MGTLFALGGDILTLSELDAGSAKSTAKPRSSQDGGLLSGAVSQDQPTQASIAPVAGVLQYPYLTLVRQHLQEGRIQEARKMLEIAGDAIPQGSKIREILAPPRIKKSSEKGFDRSAEFDWLKTKAAPYKGRWVALLGGQLLASAGSLKELLAEIRVLQPERKPLIHRID